MVFISLAPFLPKRIFALTIAVLGLSIVSCFADPVLFSVKKTPYDHQMARIQPVLNSSASVRSGTLPLSLVNHWIAELRGIPYSFSMEWKTPAEVAREPAADCKGKAVVLYQRMREYGARNLRLVIGKRAPTSRSTHTWVEWTTASATYVLDPTINWIAYSASEIPETCYIPYYAYTGAQKYRAASAAPLYARL